MWQISFHPNAAKRLEKLPQHEQARILKAGMKLQTNPFARGDVASLKGSSHWRLRVGRWRVIFSLNHDAGALHVLTLGPRGGVYKYPFLKQATQPPSEDAMPVQYLVDEHGNRTAALVPIDEWRDIQASLADTGQTLSPQKAQALDREWQAFESGQEPGTPLDDIEQELLHERPD